jgi:DNA-binding NarL/FixJ family response regulator
MTSVPTPAAAMAGAPERAPTIAAVGVVEDNPGLRRSFERLVSRAPGCRCVGAWPDGQSALDQLPALQPDVVLMDIHLPGMSGIECTARLKRLSPRTQVIMVTVYEDTDNIFRALQAGASGYLLKRASSADILEAIVEVRQGGAPMSSEIARRVVEAFRTPLPEPDEPTGLSARERELLELLAQGFSNKEIAERLGIAYQTVKVHLKHIYEKLHVRSRTEALLKFMGDRGLAPGSAAGAERGPAG